jgi:hypothetical protein
VQAGRRAGKIGALAQVARVFVCVRPGEMPEPAPAAPAGCTPAAAIGPAARAQQQQNAGAAAAASAALMQCAALHGPRLPVRSVHLAGVGGDDADLFSLVALPHVFTLLSCHAAVAVGMARAVEGACTRHAVRTASEQRQARAAHTNLAPIVQWLPGLGLECMIRVLLVLHASDTNPHALSVFAFAMQQLDPQITDVSLPSSSLCTHS